MSAYIVADVIVTNEAQMAEYRQWSTRAMQEFDAEIVVRGGDPEVLEGTWAPKRIVILKFSDRARARAYYSSATYTRARKVREHAGSIQMILVDSPTA
jgi:uncharacterized protein (DUF1330 family)